MNSLDLLKQELQNLGAQEADTFMERLEKRLFSNIPEQESFVLRDETNISNEKIMESIKKCFKNTIEIKEFKVPSGSIGVFAQLDENTHITVTNISDWILVIKQSL